MPFDASPLNEEEQRLIDEHLDFYHALARGKRKPATEAQRHFVAVCEGKAKAKTQHELAYLKYLRYESRHRPRPRNACVSILASNTEWCSNRDWKRMRAGNFADMKKRQREG